ncbi:hypothetical protein [Anaerofustis stercorihominis]|uniref:hypothetical protein n=1 Tax=Anaerofustis stercorihominis TaxID=214853 RepID=UPI0039843734
MAAFGNQIIAFVNSARPLIIALVIFSFLIAGGMLIYPSERSKQAAKDALPWIVIGAAIALGAVTIGTSITSGF